VATLLALLGFLFAPVQHVTIAATASAASGAPGSKVSLFVDVAPNAGIHVYAPGAADYQPIAVKLDATNGMIAAGKLTYPKSERLLVAGAPEAVPVFQKPFRLVQEVTIGKSAKPGSTLTVTGRVEYQACDDVVCFLPATLPVSWTIAVKTAAAR
jgi:DsbC/DsbD-like thiol-disulfide interchange protein